MIYIFLALSIVASVLINVLCNLMPHWWNVLTIPGIAIGAFILISGFYMLFLFLWSFTVDKTKERKGISSFFRWLFVQTDIFCLFWTNVHVHIEGKEKIPKGERYLIVSNHLSNYDPMSILSSLRKEKIVFISKPENFNIKMVGALMYKAGFMAIDRDNVKNAIVTINKAADIIKRQEANIFIFPEGTRNRTETPLLEFRNGAFKIATKAGCPIVIAAVSETEKVKKRIPRRSDVYVKIIEVIPAEKVKEMRTADISEYAWNLIYANITHGKKTEE